MRCFLCLSLVNLPLLTSLEERSTHRELDCFLGVEDNGLDRDDLANEATGDRFALFWKAVILPVVESLSCF